jgi:hypothetical protein
MGKTNVKMVNLTTLFTHVKGDPLYISTSKQKEKKRKQTTFNLFILFSFSSTSLRWDKTIPLNNGLNARGKYIYVCVHAAKNSKKKKKSVTLLRVERK